MATYIKPKTRPSTPLNGQQIYASAGTPLDVSFCRPTSAIAGSNGRIVAVGDTLYEANNLTKPVRMIGNNMGASLTLPLDPALASTCAAKMKAEGIGIIRLHAFENYLMTDGPIYGAAVARAGNVNISPTRWNELCIWIEAFRANGIYIIFNPGANNLAIDMGTNPDRYSSVANTSGSITVTVSGGEITALATNVASTGHTYPPYVLISVPDGSTGVGAKYEAILTGGTVTGFTKIRGGSGYVSGQVTATYFGGYGRCKALIRDHSYVQNSYDLLYTYLLTTPSTITGQPFLNDPILAMCEGYNESHMMAPVSGAFLASGFRGFFKPIWQKWLSDFFGGDIEALKTKCGIVDAGIVAFSHATFDYRLEGAAGTTLTDRVMMALSRSWTKAMDVAHYKRMVDHIRSVGYTGLIAMRDMGGDATAIKDNIESGATVQQFHVYPTLADTNAPGAVMSSAGQRNNAPSSYGELGPVQCMNTLIKDVPRVWTEFGWPMWGKSRGEMGLLAAIVSASYNFSMIIFHSASPIGLTYGPSNPTQQKGLASHQWEFDFLQAPSVKACALIYLRGDIPALPISKTLAMNNRALSIFTSPSEFTDPFYSSRQQFIPNDYNLLLTIARIENTWDATNNAGVATTWQGSTGIGEVAADFMNNATYGFNSNTYEAFRWFITDGNNEQFPTGDRAFSAMRYPKSRVNFIDRQSGIMGVNTPRNQSGVASSTFRNKLGSLIKQGSRFASNPNRKIKSETGPGFILNCYGNRFWQNLEINNIEDNVLLSVHSLDSASISDSNNLLFILASNCYNNGVTFQSNILTSNGLPNKRITGWNITTRGTYTKAPWVRVSGTGNGAVGRCVLGVDGGIDSVFMEDEGVNYANTLTPTGVLVDGVGSGGVLGTPIFSEDDDPQREICVLTPFVNDGNEGWPWGQALHRAEFVLRDIDGSQPWTVHELLPSGARVPNGEIASTKLSNTAVQFNIDSAQTVYPCVYFHAVKGQVARKPRG
jgi:hypothetical protein